LLLLGTWHHRLPIADHVGAVERRPGAERDVQPLKGDRRLAERGHEFLTRLDRLASDEAFPLRAGDVVARAEGWLGRGRRGRRGGRGLGRSGRAHESNPPCTPCWL